MKSIKLTLLTAISAASLMGCAAKPEAITPVAFSDTHSFAYNIAAQTALTRDNSPLRDFTQQEIDETKTKLTKKSGAGVSEFFGAMRILTGDLIGVIDVAGGAATSLAHKNHTASKSRWIIAVPVEQFNREDEAQEYILNSVHTAANKVLHPYGEVKNEVTKDQRFTVTKVVVDGESYPVGVVSKINHKGKHLLTRTQFPFNGEFKEAYVYGLDKNSLLIKNMLVGIPTPAFLNVKTKNINFVDFNKQFTKELPDGFFLYTPSFPQFHGNGVTYTYTSEIVPAIYSQGKKHEFIQPE
ncbi:hypothetical protein CSW98_10215 [Vibrio sp. HA2012]|uniref:hypothetical protein n=1 Tax=Vibrio sp. HA2012 TaxID=1971595 RepID=UPI000C2B76D8|nr:hypothetical protein [Vibrio sp. HA2012]PJC86569.1 hypothetical protein CSW98_10215 [Vibrio sp. HA2012]